MFDERKFKSIVVLKGKSLKDVAKSLDIDYSTLLRKIKKEGNFTRGEINILIEVLEIENPISIFFA